MNKMRIGGRTVRSVWYVTLLCLSASLFGCTTRMADFTILSSKNVDLSRMESYKRGGNRVRGEDMVFIFLFIPFGGANGKEAIDRAIQQVPGAIALVDGVMYTSSWWFLVGQSGFVVEGTPLIDPSLAKADDTLKSPYIVGYFDPIRQSQQVKYVDRDTFQSLRKIVREGNPKTIGDCLSKIAANF